MSSDAFVAMAVPRLGDRALALRQEKAAARGHAAGYADGLRAAQRELDARTARLDAEHGDALRRGDESIGRAVDILHRAARALDESALPLLAESYDTLAAAAIDLAEAIIGYELADGERSARAALDRALAAPNAEEARTVRLHPDDLAALGDDLRGRLAVALAPDPSLARGDAVAEFADGYLDARLSTALARAKAVLRGAAA